MMGTTEDRFRALAHSMPPSDFGSTRAIQAAAKLADQLVAEALELRGPDPSRPASSATARND
jgi:hypothetical protein